jgi:hypothetical protein
MRRHFWRWSVLASAFALACSTPPEPQDAAPDVLFREVAQGSGLVFQHFIGATGEYFIPEIMGAGAALLDYDNDGDLDVYLIQGAMLDGGKNASDARFPPPASHWPGNRLYRNEIVPTGKLTFVDVTDAAKVGHAGYGMGAATGDYDNDGDEDLFVTSFGANVLYRNEGDGTFRDVTSPGLDDPRWSTSASFLDYDGDGDLDLFFTNYVDFSLRNNKACFDPTGARDYCAPTVYRPVPDRLFRNESGKFVDVSQAAGLGRAYGNGLGVTCADFNGDGRIDIYVANDGTANQLWMNNGDGTFSEEALMAGAAYDADGAAEAGMGVSAGDFDEDGDEDLFLTHLKKETNTLYVNSGRAQFRDQTDRYGLGAVSIPYTGFGMQWFDYDLDGRLDLFVANGAVTIEERLRGQPYPFQQRNLLFRLAESGTFQDVTASAGPAFSLEEVSRGAAFGDLDNDGDVDIVVTNNNGPARLLLNEADARKHWVRARLTGVEANRDAIGARVALLRVGKAPKWGRVYTDGSYLSASELTVTFGLGRETSVEGIGVVWPGGGRERFPAEVDRVNVLRQGEGSDW